MENKIPKNWVLVELEKLGENKYYAIGDGDHGQIKPLHYKENGIPYIRVSDIGWGNFKPEKLVYISEEIHNKNLKSELLPGDILIAKTGATIGKCCIVPDYISKANTTSSVGKVSINSKLVSNKWILYYFLSPDFYKLMWSKSSRTAQPGFNIIHLKQFLIPLPPLPEQERIVAKLDTLFAQHEAMKKALECIPQLLKDFRQQVLTHAVTGKLTEKWREKTNNLVEWELKKLDEISLSITDGDHQAPPKSESGVPFLVISNISDGKLNFNHISRYVPINYYEKLKDIRKPNTGDILYTVTGSYGIPVLINEKIDFCFQRHIAIIKPDPQKVYNIFLYYYLKSQNILEQAKECATGTAQLTVPLSGLRKFILKVPTILEQHEIINRIENLFSKADIIEERYKNLKEKIDSLPQAILHKAFKGELVPQLPTDGDAKDLLEEILKLKKEVKKK